ncbi:EF-hand domain-containing protein [Planctobacterium marinum]|nr:EF-hand domain-containing protein [Planctobacterium marinum]
MTSITGASGVDPQAMMQKMQEKLQQADTDNNGALSKAELTESMEEVGHTPSNMDKMFERMDADGDGELSQEEQLAAQEKMQQRLAQFQSMGAGSGLTGMGYQQNSAFQNLLDSLDTDSDEDQDLKAAIEQVQNGNGLADQQPWQILNEKMPPINTYA